jgi:hypothetical protein
MLVDMLYKLDKEAKKRGVDLSGIRLSADGAFLCEKVIKPVRTIDLKFYSTVSGQTFDILSGCLKGKRVSHKQFRKMAENDEFNWKTDTVGFYFQPSQLQRKIYIGVT